MNAARSITRPRGGLFDQMLAALMVTALLVVGMRAVSARAQGRLIQFENGGSAWFGEDGSLSGRMSIVGYTEDQRFVVLLPDGQQLEFVCIDGDHVAPAPGEADFHATPTDDGGFYVIMASDSLPMTEDPLMMPIRPLKSPSQRVAGTWRPHVMGAIELTKASALPELTDSNPCYTLEGAHYGIWKDRNLTQESGREIVTDAAGHGSSGQLGAGTYYVKETVAPPGYALDDRVYVVEVAAGDTSQVNGGSVTDEPLRARPRAIIQKLDAEDSSARPRGAASLTGAEFVVNYYANTQGDTSSAPTRSWVLRADERGQVLMDEEHKLSGDDFFLVDGQAVLPVGTLSIKETKAPKGYLPEEAGETKVHVLVMAEGDGPTTFEASLPLEVRDQVRRSDLEFVKVEEGSMRRIANAPFLICSKTTGEAHVVVSDANGRISTSASQHPHSARTNANDAFVDIAHALTRDGEGNWDVDEGKLKVNDEASWDSGAGVWFSGGAGRGSEADDARGALPFDSYSVVELPCKANHGLRLVRFGCSVEQEGKTVDAGTVTDALPPRIATTLTGPSHEHVGPVSQAVTLTDHVELEGLQPHSSYRLEGRLRLVGPGGEDAGPVMRDGKELVVTQELSPQLSRTSCDVEFELDSRGLAGRSVVAYERLLKDGRELARHEDPKDQGQTLRFPAIHTMAADEGGAKELCAEGETVMVDTVSFENLQEHVTYELLGVLVDAETGEELKDDGGRTLTARAQFTPSAPDGTQEVSFHIDGRPLEGSSVVVFETLLHDGVVLVGHEDLMDLDQTVSFPRIRTELQDAQDGSHVIPSEGPIRLEDTVSFSRLTPGKEYLVEGSLMDPATGRPLRNKDGEPLRASRAFTPEKRDGAVVVEFELDGSSLPESGAAVAFETLSCEGRVVARHEDPNDEAQTVSHPPHEDPKPEPAPRQGGRRLAQTGIPAIGVMLACIGAMVLGASTIARPRLRKVRRRRW
ncbi:VaFE repeat-containing surface-anchored protein [Olsenella urininfantis]|uniref:VaFE repeat-containing surface-anchored protein n=1 Tax=Olsenella urininfantis TaxID=1871033 RepID=UPI000987D22F|nr:VaFE repeat-containing surface-anchored protein [Olsenella urininfantis]